MVSESQIENVVLIHAFPETARPVSLEVYIAMQYDWQRSICIAFLGCAIFSLPFAY